MQLSFSVSGKSFASSVGPELDRVLVEDAAGPGEVVGRGLRHPFEGAVEAELFP